MSSFYQGVIGTSWAVWVLYWIVSAANVKRTLRREPLHSRAAHFLPMVLAFGLLAAPPGPDTEFLFARFVPVMTLLQDFATLMVVSGLLFAVWARVHLGSNWSGRVTLKENHELIRTGPYQLVRHPIYTGLLLAILGTALALGEWRGLLATVMMVISFWRKLQLEEALMRQTFGDEYRRYCEHTAALIPYVI
ncbi:MAG TPA: isoprenylcysteine carboxylmethyltransferase family protein [Steroidobacteraceae bacterium]|nr:isoprenylcysteine carboxylmethyltransferase family protein [Steroidobacteraceae bacterium]